MANMEKIDLTKQFKEEYSARKKPFLLDVGKATYLMVSGRGAPGGDEFQVGIGALYGAAYTIKMTRKFSGQQDYVVCKLEGQWWSDSGDDFANIPKEEWQWNLFIRTPDFVKQKELDTAIKTLLDKGKDPSVKQVRLESFVEGKCVQMLHVGPYEKEGETVQLMQSFAEEQRFTFKGLHHDIYLSDPRRVPPERLKTILRRPVKLLPD